MKNFFRSALTVVLGLLILIPNLYLIFLFLKFLLSLVPLIPSF